MPREHKKRGRREDRKRKREEEERVEDKEHAAPSKRQRPGCAEKDVEFVVAGDDGSALPDEYTEYAARPGDLPFYGLLDEEEQEYFKRADSMLELNQFADAEERKLFLANVYKEADGKELKIASSQSCSRLMERLILLSTPSQLKNLFQKFNGHFLHLFQHRFASHCCEALFIKATPIVNQELTAPVDQKQDQDNGEVYVSMENLFLYTLNELEGNVGFLMSDQFASHPLRVLLVVLSGMPLPAVNSSSLLQSKRKEHISVSGTNVTYEGRTEARMVPDSFHAALDKMMASAIGGLETTYLRALATHPIANPALQLLLELELTRSAKQSAKDAKSLFRKLLPDDPLEEGTESVSFINSLIYDAIGSRLVEIIITHAPGKNFKALYKSWLREKLGTLAKNEVAAFVVIRIVERLNKEDLKTATEQICSQIDSLIKCSRTSVIKVLIERCRIRQVDCSQISAALEKAYGDEPSQRLMKMLYLDTAPADGMAEDRRKRLDSHDRSKAHGSLLAQCMLESPDPLRGIIADSLLAMDETSLMAMAKDRTASRVLQSALVCHGQTPKFRRLLIPCFYGHMEELANDPVASHVVDSLWTASSSLTFIRERIADELAQHESSLRACISGRAVWRNWKMDSYKTRRKDWLKDGKEQEKPSTTSIELARERFAAGKTTKQRQQASKTKAGKTTGANSIPQGAATSHTSHGSRNSLVGVA